MQPSSWQSAFARSNPTKVAQIDSRPLCSTTTGNNLPCKSEGRLSLKHGRFSASNISTLHWWTNLRRGAVRSKASQPIIYGPIEPHSGHNARANESLPHKRFTTQRPQGRARHMESALNNIRLIGLLIATVQVASLIIPVAKAGAKAESLRSIPRRADREPQAD